MRLLKTISVLGVCLLFAGALAFALLRDPPEGGPEPRRGASPARMDERPFARNAVWNSPVPRGAELDPASPGLVAELGRQVDRFGPFINSTRFSTPVYTVPGGRPGVAVRLDQHVPDLEAALEQVPIPAGAAPATGSQRHLVVWQPATDTMWELWKAERRSDGWHAQYGGRMQAVSRNPGYFTDPPIWGATATSLPLLGGLIRTDELRRGRIDHALAFALPEVRAEVFSAPAQRTDGQVQGPGAIPHGARFRLDPALDLDSMELPRATRVIAQAAQRYGMILRDKSGSVSLYAEQPRDGPDPYPQLFGGQSASQVMSSFPWNRLQALRLDLRS